MLFFLSISSIIEILLLLVPSLMVIAFVTIAERKTMASMQRRLGPVWGFGNFSLWDKLSNSGETLKLMVPNYSWKIMCGWINYSCMVISQKIYENIMGDRGSKSVYTTVKEQRVDGGWCVYSTHLRYTLMGFERNYQIKIPSNQMNKLRFYSTDSKINSNYSLDPYFLTGFADAESSFMVLVLKEPNNKIGWTVKPRFSIGLHKKDVGILNLIKSYLSNTGSILKQGKNSMQYRVSSLRDITNVVIPHFNKYPLITQKRADFLLFKEIVDLIIKKEHLTIEGIRKIVALKASLNLGLTDDLKVAFPDIVPVTRPLVKYSEILDPNWLAGFSSGEGCFSVRLKKSIKHRLGFQTILTFKLTQHIRDKELMENFISYLNCGSVYTYLEEAQYMVINTEDLVEKIIPFFDKYKILGVKNLDYQNFKKVIELVKNKEHLTTEGLDKILELKESMNKGRNSV